MTYNRQRKVWNGEAYEVSNREEKEKNRKQILIKNQVMCRVCT